METASKAPSIEEYAAYVLADERVDRTLKKIEASNRMAQHFTSLESDGARINKDELVYAEGYRKALRRTGEKNVLEIIRKSMPERWLFLNNINDIAHNVIAGEPSYDDLPIIMLWHFASHVKFRRFLVTGDLVWFNNVLPAERRLQFVFALFLWLEMDARYDMQTRRAYYVKAQADKLGSSRENRLVSTVSERKRFIVLFKDYIHTDVWTAQDYDKQGKQGTVIRLRLTDSLTGQIVVQECGERSASCNKLYLVNAETTEKIEGLYLKQGKLLRSSQSSEPPNLSFQCHACGNEGACHFKPMCEPVVFYHLECYCVGK